MFQIYLLPLSTEELSKPYTKRLPCSILFKPTSPQQKQLAVIYLHGWNGYPYSSLARSLGAEIASKGYIFLSLGMRRRGVEGQMKALPDDDIEDIQRGVEYLAACGLNEIILIGEEIGALSAVKYQSKIQDSRIKGIALISPVLNLPVLLENAIGKDRYRAIYEKSDSAVIKAVDGEAWVDLTINAFNDQPMLIYQSFASWLAWWGSNADTKIDALIESVFTPILLIQNQAEKSQEIFSLMTPDSKIVDLDDQAQLANILFEWASKLGSLGMSQFDMESHTTAPLEIVTVKTSDRTSLVGLLWENHNCLQSKTAVLHVRGKTGTPLTEPLFSKLAEVYNQHNIAALVIELRRSGYGGSLRATSEMDVDDINAFVEFLSERGYTRIILSGQSLGSNSIMRYQVQRHHPNAIALVHMAPTQDCANWLQKHIGTDTYHSLYAQAYKAIQAGKSEEGLIGKPPYEWMLSPQRPNSWLSWWGLEADTVNLTAIAQVDIPILLLCGSKDFFNDRERLNQLQQAATSSPVTSIIWYEGCGHDFAGFEQQAAQDVINWLNTVEQNHLL